MTGEVSAQQHLEGQREETPSSFHHDCVQRCLSNKPQQEQQDKENLDRGDAQ